MRRKIQATANDGVGPIRDMEGLATAVSRLASIRARFHTLEPGAVMPQVAEWETSNVLATASVLASAALTRTESRGGHIRSDYPAHRRPLEGTACRLPRPGWRATPHGGSARTWLTAQPAHAGPNLARFASPTATTRHNGAVFYPEELSQDSPLDPGVLTRIVAAALDEDLGPAPGRDVTTQATIPTTEWARGAFVARADGVVAGLAAVPETLTQVANRLGLRRAKLRLQRGGRRRRGGGHHPGGCQRGRANCCSSPNGRRSTF